MITFTKEKHGPLAGWIVHNIQTGPMGNEGEIWGCQVSRSTEPKPGLDVHYAGGGGQVEIREIESGSGLRDQFLSDCEGCLRKIFPGRQVPAHRIEIAEGILALASCDDERELEPKRMRELLSYLLVNEDVVVGYDSGSKDGDSMVAFSRNPCDPDAPPVFIGRNAGQVDLWSDDHIQFARLLAEIKMAGLGEETLKLLRESMDLETEQICEILDRAEACFEKSKAERLRPNVGSMPGTPMECLHAAEEFADDGSFPEAYAAFLEARKRFRAQEDYDPLSSAAERISDGIQRCRDSGQV